MPDTVSISDVAAAVDTLWVLIAAVLVMLMQAGFMFLEIGFSRMKNAGTIVAKILLNFSIAGIAYWAVGFALAFGGAGWFAGDSAFFLHIPGAVADSIPALDGSGVDPKAFFFFQFVFAGVSLAVVWGTTLERLKFGVYLIYAVIFGAVIYPLISHWIFGGGWLQANLGMQDFAGSTVVHLIGATGGLAVLLLLGSRLGKYDTDGKPNVIPGHSMPLVGLGVMLLWFGWFGFNPGSTLAAIGGRFAEVAVVTNLAAAAGVITAAATIYAKTRSFDIGMVGNGAIAALVGITAPSGYVEVWAAPIIGGIAGVIVVYGVLFIEKLLDDPIGALSAHGLAGIWGTLSCGLFTSTRLASENGVGHPGFFYSGSFHQLGVQSLGVGVSFAVVFSISFAIFYLIKKTYGLRVEPEDERRGLDIVEHGMWGYPEQFMPVPGSEYHQPAAEGLASTGSSPPGATSQVNP